MFLCFQTCTLHSLTAFCGLVAFFSLVHEAEDVLQDERPKTVVVVRYKVMLESKLRKSLLFGRLRTFLKVLYM